MNTKNDIILWGLIGCALGTVLAVLVLPGWIPALAASITNGTAYWLLARAGGFVAYGLLWLSVVFGLLMTGKIARHWPGTRQANAIHQSLSLFAVIYTAFHALILLGDRYIGFNLLGLLVPFASGYEPLWVGPGQVGLYLLLIVTFSFYLRKHIGAKTWRALHYGSFSLYLLVTVHSLLAGTDTSTLWAFMFYVVTGMITYALTVYRVLIAVQSKREPKQNLALAVGKSAAE